MKQKNDGTRLLGKGKILLKAGLLAILSMVLCLQAFAADGDVVTAKTYKFGPKIAEWSAVNKDIKGWVYVGGTNINYPVAYGGADRGNNYYMNLGYDLKPSKNGVIWADKYCKVGTSEEISPNTVLYGHNWLNYSGNPRIGDPRDVMFGQLTAYHHLDFAKEHQFIQYSTENANLVYQVFAVFYTEVNFAYNTSNARAEEMKTIISGARNRSLHDFDIEVSTSDKIITLSTCSRAFGGSDQQRFVVMGKLVASGTEPVAVTANPDFQKPKL